MRTPAQLWASCCCYQSSAPKATRKRASEDRTFWFSDASGEVTGHPSYTKQTRPGMFTCLRRLILTKCAAGQPLIPQRKTRGCRDTELSEPTKDLHISLLFTFSPLRLFPWESFRLLDCLESNFNGCYNFERRLDQGSGEEWKRSLDLFSLLILYGPSVG